MASKYPAVNQFKALQPGDALVLPGKPTASQWTMMQTHARNVGWRRWSTSHDVITGEFIIRRDALEIPTDIGAA